MALPDFNADERYMINAVKSNTGMSNAYMWGYLIAGLLMGGFGVYHNSVPLMACAFLVVCGFRLYEEWYQRKWLPIWRSIIDKYEASATGREHSSGSASD